MTFNAAGLHDRTITEYNLNIDNANNVKAYHVENELLSSAQDFSLLDVVVGIPATIIKNSTEAVQSIFGTNSDANYSAAYIPEAIGQRIEVTAADENGQKLNYFERTGVYDRATLHFMDSMLNSLNYEINQQSNKH